MGGQVLFAGISSEQQLLSYLKKQGLYQDLEANVIGRRWEVKRDKGTSKQRQVEVDDIFYYVPTWSWYCSNLKAGL